ncbi:hypothetical protein SISNIDRAFT_214950 [Sistotremastrum niveocremeum HHB9708]|uniref:Uncharacterized protein n=1 Tax=Sistotremastrum niveocremeum HHB9708 TaxID=1314777 RepID=A0A164QTG2_9AGAM|nr:hypothetical protein SISNIDRAFT_214950 [Sistotremastrum niveocremeum HHB9708]
MRMFIIILRQLSCSDHVIQRQQIMKRTTLNPMFSVLSWNGSPKDLLLGVTYRSVPPCSASEFNHREP